MSCPKKKNRPTPFPAKNSKLLPKTKKGGGKKMGLSQKGKRRKGDKARAPSHKKVGISLEFSAKANQCAKTFLSKKLKEKKKGARANPPGKKKGRR